ncbi:MAG: tetraacyldisaccharide 4'-kinase, partial [Planctomycetota bacterium]
SAGSSEAPAASRVGRRESASAPRRELPLAERGGWVELLRAPAALFGVVARVRSGLYRRRVLPSYDVDAAVVSVGNLSAGGTGKTPMTAWIVRALLERGLVPAIVSRGYGASDGAPNDEARMLHELFPTVAHVSDRDRVGAAQRAVDQGADVVVVDDGFQHRRLARDLDVVLVDALRPFGLPRPSRGTQAPHVEAMLPRGLMREPLSALARADVVVVTRADRVDASELDALLARLRSAAPGRPIATAVHAPVRLRARRPVGDNYEDRPLAELAGLEVDAFSGIGNPGAFEATLRALGATVVEHRVFPDHHAFAPDELRGLGTERPVVTTAKDAARLASGAPPHMLVVDVELRFLTGEDELRAALMSLPVRGPDHRRAALHGGVHG